MERPQANDPQEGIVLHLAPSPEPGKPPKLISDMGSLPLTDLEVCLIEVLRANPDVPVTSAIFRESDIAQKGLNEARLKTAFGSAKVTLPYKLRQITGRDNIVIGEGTGRNFSMVLSPLVKIEEVHLEQAKPPAPPALPTSPTESKPKAKTARQVKLKKLTPGEIQELTLPFRLPPREARSKSEPEVPEPEEPKLDQLHLLLTFGTVQPSTLLPQTKKPAERKWSPESLGSQMELDRARQARRRRRPNSVTRRQEAFVKPELADRERKVEAMVKYLKEGGTEPDIRDEEFFILSKQALQSVAGTKDMDNAEVAGRFKQLNLLRVSYKNQH